MTDQAEVEAYNYARFVGEDRFLDFRAILPVGSMAPDTTLTLLDTEQPVRLSEYWRERDVLIEFGSLT